MRTTLDLPEALVKEAMKVSHQRSKTATIIAALQDLIRKNRLQQLKTFRGKLDLDLIIAQNARQHGVSLLSHDRHFRLMSRHIGLAIF